MDRRQAWAQRDRLRAEDRERLEHRAERHQAWDPVDQHPTAQAWDPEHRGREEHPTARRQVWDPARPTAQAWDRVRPAREEHRAGREWGRVAPVAAMAEARFPARRIKAPKS
jgi:hypothetical protein